MGYKLRREVRDHLPAGLLTGGERCLVLELADWCNDDTREGWPGVEWLADAADVPESKVGEMFARIARKWVELRVPLGFGKDGRPFYARSGQRTVYRFPTLAAPANEVTQNGGPSRIEAPQNGVPEAPQNRGAEAPQNGGARYPKTGGPSPQGSPQRTSSSLSSGDGPPSALAETETEGRERDELDQDSETYNAALAHPRRLLAEQCGITDTDEADMLIGNIEDHEQVRSPGFWVTVGNNGTLPGLVGAAQDRITTAERTKPETRPDAHEYQPGPAGHCATCGFPRPNGRHYRIAQPQWDVSILDQRYAAQAAQRRRNGHQPYLNAAYTDADYHQPL